MIQADNLLVDNNVASGAGGGGIHNTGGSEIPNQDGWLVLTDTTIFKNSATGIGGVGGIDSSGNGALITLSRTTIADNVGGTRGVGGFSPTGSTAAVGHDPRAQPRGRRASSTAATTSPPTAASTSRTTRDCNLAPGGDEARSSPPR